MKRNPCKKCGCAENSVSADCGHTHTYNGVGHIGVRMHYVYCHGCRYKGPRANIAEDAVKKWNDEN